MSLIEDKEFDLGSVAYQAASEMAEAKELAISELFDAKFPGVDIKDIDFSRIKVTVDHYDGMQETLHIDGKPCLVFGPILTTTEITPDNKVICKFHQQIKRLCLEEE